MSKQTIKDRILEIKNEKKLFGNTKVRVADVLTDINESKVDVGEIPTKTSDLQNNGQDGLNPFITVKDIPDVILPTKTSDLQNNGQDGLNPFITIQDIPVITVPTKTSDLANNGEGISPFITLNEVPPQTPQVKSDWNSLSGPEEILNKPIIPTVVPQEQSDWNATSGVSFIRNKPTIPTPVDISGKLDKPLDPNNTPDRVILADGSTKPLSEITTDISNKLDKTTTTVTAPDSEYKYAYILNETNTPRRMLAGDLGKNIANSSLTSIAGSGMTLGAPYTWNAANQPFSITGLPDKSADATFATMLVENAAGQVAKSNGNPLIKEMPSLLTEAEKTVWKTEMNGGWTTNTMSISDIFPPILKFQNQNSYLSVRGANLNLNPANFSISICSVNSTSISPIILAVVNNSQVTLISPTDFAFYYNFNSLGVGEYKLLINNGISSYLSTYTFLVKENVDYLDLGNITWNTKTLGDIETSDMQAGGGGILFRPNSLVYPIADEPKILFKAKTELPLFYAGDDFYLEFNINFTNIEGNNSSTFSFGLSSSPDSSTLVNDINKAVSLTLTANQFITNMSGNSGTGYTSQNVGVVFIKRGTYIIMRSTFNMYNAVLQQKTETISDVNDLYFTGIFQNMDSTSKTFNISITSAYKF